VTFDELGGWTGTLARLVARQDLTEDHAAAAMAEILAGEATPAQLAAFVMGLRTKGETAEELSGLLRALLDAAVPVELPADIAARAVDTCGTGGDQSHSINVSTLAALVLAGAGVPVCKHGNRAASSACGSADLLEALGVALELDGPGVARCVVEAGIGFCFAPRFHAALRHAGPTRRELGIPTAFNVLGPLANPARVRRQVLGVADPAIAERMLRVLAGRGAVATLVVHGDDGLDELTTTTTSTMFRLDADGQLVRTTIDPQQLGLDRAAPEDLLGGDAACNAGFAGEVLAGEKGPRRDVVVLNAAAGLVVAGAVDDLADGIELAGTVLDEGRAADALERLVRVSQQAASPASRG